jgi:capsular polysaccharide export protein
MSMVVDRTGIFYRADAPSDLGNLLADRGWYTPAVEARARQAVEQLRRLRLSKYNSGPERTPRELGLGPDARRRILVLDQVRDDASIRGALADSNCFRDMLAAARAEDPDAEVAVKVHPDVLAGRRAGYFSELVPGRVKLVAEPVNPWSLLDAADTLYTVSSGLGFEAALAGKRVVTFGSPFYAGWGFTDDRRLRVKRERRVSPLELFAAFHLRYVHYLDAYSRHEIEFEAAAEQLAWLRDRFLAQRSRAVCFDIKRWKRSSVDRMLDGPAGPPLHTRRVAGAIDLASKTGGHVVAWASRDTSSLESACRATGIRFVRVEDGFVRSAGLGASFVRPLSLVFDERGIYYDSGSGSDLEALLQGTDFTPSLLERARRLRETLVATGTTKYNVDPNGGAGLETDGRPVILVPGQVEDDASIQRGSPRLKRNVDLLRAVRERHPEGFVVYKPHPDVEAGFRRGRVPRQVAKRFADRIVTQGSILSLIAACDRVETIASLAGFEALLRGRPVTTHGQPFYAGWGLTEDLCPVERRTRRLSLDELVAGALILYPHYLDPASGLACTPELLVGRLAAAAKRLRTGLEQVYRVAQASAARALHIGRSMKHLARRGA